jgi:hypothetical protein
MTATITDHLGQRICGEVRCWMGLRIVEVETSDGARHIGRLTPDPTPAEIGQVADGVLSTVDGAR